jgi:hypothetical protein
VRPAAGPAPGPATAIRWRERYGRQYRTAKFVVGWLIILGFLIGFGWWLWHEYLLASRY